MHFSYQAVDNTTGTVHVWTSALPDPEGAGYPGPNSPTCILQTNNPLEDLVVPETLEYQTLAAARLSGALADGTFCRIVEGCKEFRYSATSGAGWEDDGDTILRPVHVELGENGRFFSTRASEHAATFAAFRAMKGLLGRAKHVHVESHTTFGDGGGGIFDVKPVGAYVDNNGTVLVNGTAAGVRRGAETGPVPSEWFGVQYDATVAGGGTDSTTALFAALAYANGLVDADEFETGEGDHEYETTGRRNRPVRISGPCRVTRKIPVRWRGVQIIGDLTGTDAYQTKSSCIFIDHAGPGIECWTGDNAYEEAHPEYQLTPSLSIEGLSVIRTTPNQAAGLDGISVDGRNWFMGLRVWNCTVSGHRNGCKFQATLYTAKIASNIIIGGRSYFMYNREYGVDIQYFCQLSDLRSFSVWHNGLGGFRLWGDGSCIEAIDVEGQPANNELAIRSGRAGMFYAEACVPYTSPVVRLVGSYDSVLEGIAAPSPNEYHYKLSGCERIRVTDRKPVGTTRCYNIESPAGLYPPQAFTDGTTSLGHTLDSCAYLAKSVSLSPSIVSDVVLMSSPGLYPDSDTFDGIRLPATATVGTVGAPTYATSIGSLARTFTAGRIYLIAYAIKYAHKAPGSHRTYLILDEGVNQHVALNSQYTPSVIGDSSTVQVIEAFSPETTTTAFKLYVFPYGTESTPTDYGARISEVFTAEIKALSAIPLFHVPTLLRGAPFVGSVALNGATPVTLADTGAKVTSNVRTERTAIGGTMAAYNIAWAAGVGYTLTGTAGDTSTITVSRDC